MWPTIDSSIFLSAWEDDIMVIDRRDTMYTRKEWNAYELSKMKMLQPAIVKGWKNVRKDLDHLYTTGPFSEPALYSFDLRTYSSDYNRDIFWYLNAQGCGLRYDPLQDSLKEVNGHPVNFFVDEVQYDAPFLRTVDFDKIAYIKILKSDFLSTTGTTFSLRKIGSGSNQLGIPVQKTPLNVLIYTRKGKDFRTMRGGLNTMYVKGYDKILPFYPNNRIFFWSPSLVGNKFAIRFNNTEKCRKFRVKVSGITPDGKIAFSERIITVNDNNTQMADKGKNQSPVVGQQVISSQQTGEDSEMLSKKQDK